MSAVAFCASIYMTLAVTVHCQKYSRTKSNRQSSCIQLTKIVQRLNGTLLCAGPTSTGQLAWPWQTPDACWSTSSQSPPSPSPSTSPSSWRWQWLSTMEQTRLTLPRQERIQPSFSGEIYKFIYTSTFNAWQITGGIHSTRPNGISIFLGKVHTFTDVASNADNRGASLPRPPLYELTHLFHDQVVFYQIIDYPQSIIMWLSCLAALAVLYLTIALCQVSENWP